MSTKLPRCAIVALLSLAVLTVPLAASAQGNITFFVTDVDATKFPVVQFELRAVDLSNQVVANVNSTNLSVYENGELAPNVEVTPHTDGPLNIVFVVDLGRLSNYRSFGLNNIRLAIATLVNGGYFVDGQDTAQILGRQNINSDQTLTLLPLTSRGSDLTNWAANFNFQAGGSPTKGLLGVEDAISAINAQVPIAGSQAAAVIFISRRIEDPRDAVAVTAAQAVAQTAKENYISVYTFHTDLAQANSQPLTVLATGSSGQYVPLQRNTVATSVDAVYKILGAQRTTYTVTYRSHLGTAGPRQISINTAQAPSAGVAGRYEIDVQPPAVQIVEPSPNTTIRREAKPGADGATFVYDNNSVSVKAGVTWSGGNNPRNIKSAELLVDGVVQDTAHPAPGETEIQFEWDISDIVTEGLTSVKVEVRAVDELNVEAVGEATINIEVIPPPAPEPENPLTSFLSKYWPFLLIAGLGLLIMVAVIGVLVYLTRPVPEQAPKPVDAVGETLIGALPEKQDALATLTVLEGPQGVIGENFYVSKALTLIGRNPKVAHIVFYPNEDSSVSRQHCTIQMEGKYFLLIDNNAANGTRVNGELLKPEVPVQLRDGDEIVLGDLARRGVKLRFNALPGEAESAGAAGMDRTFYVDDWDKDDAGKLRDH